MSDFRSDTFSLPTAEMLEAMSGAALGDDVFGEDPTVNALEAQVAALLGKEAGLYVTSGTQSNLLAIMAHCQRGDEFIAGQDAHCYRWEAGGAAVLGSVQPQPIEMAADGVIDLDKIRAAIKKAPNGYHFAPTKLLCLENTHDGHVLPSDYVSNAQSLAREHDLSLHLDGARLWNAAVAQGVAPGIIAEGFDTVSVCLSKGLGAPVGSVLTGPQNLIDEARRWRKMIGGGMRQAGVIAAAGIHAIDHHIDRLSEDHRRAARLAEGLAAVEGVTVDGPHTNMVFLSLDGIDPDKLAVALNEAGVAALPGTSMRLVCHLGVDDAGVEALIEAFAAAASPALD